MTARSAAGALGGRLGTRPLSSAGNRAAPLRRLLAGPPRRAQPSACSPPRPERRSANAPRSSAPWPSWLPSRWWPCCLGARDPDPGGPRAEIAEREALQAALDAAHKTKSELRDLAYHDDLTGLPNRSLLYDRLGVAITHSERQAGHLAVLFLDLDDFKGVKRLLGARLRRPPAGAGRRPPSPERSRRRHRGPLRGGRVRGAAGQRDRAEDAARVAAKVLDALRIRFRLDGHDVSIAASVGVSVYPGDGRSRMRS